MRTSKDYVHDLADGRAVFVAGERVDDVATHPAFRGVVDAVGDLFDLAADPARDLSRAVPEADGPVPTAFTTPRDAAGLAARGAAIRAWAERTHGWVGRGPDHVASYLAGFASRPELFDRGGRRFSANVIRWYRRVLEEGLFLTYAVTPPSTSRIAPGPGEDANPTVPPTAVAEDARGITVRGSQMLGTGAAVSDHLFVSRMDPLDPDDTAHALSFVVPLAAPGLRLVCRRPYGPDQPSSFDYPLSTRFDESDAIVVFDDVLVPWEDVFVHGDPAGLREQFFATPAHVLGNHQAQIRLVTKVQFVLGVVRKICEINRLDRNPSVTDRLGELASLAAMIEAGLVASEARAVTGEEGVHTPHRRFLYGAMGLQAELYPRIVQTVREVVGGGVIQLPTSQDDLFGDETAPALQRTLASPGVDAEQRVQLFKLAWDMIGSEFGGRHLQYEMFYAGPPAVARQNAYRHYDFTRPLAAAEGFLASYTASHTALEEGRAR